MKTNRSLGLAAAVAALVAILPGAARPVSAAAGPGADTIVVHVSDYAGVPSPELARAEGEASRIYAAAGIEAEWVSGAADTRTTRPGLHLNLVVLREDMVERIILAEHIAGGALGRAVPEAARAYVFYGRAHDLVARYGRDPVLFLGRVLAHELGHLLIGHHHWASGLMQPTLDPQSDGPAPFSEQQGKTLRALVAAQLTTRR